MNSSEKIPKTEGSMTERGVKRGSKKVSKKLQEKYLRFSSYSHGWSIYYNIDLNEYYQFAKQIFVSFLFESYNLRYNVLYFTVRTSVTISHWAQ